MTLERREAAPPRNEAGGGGEGESFANSYTRHAETYRFVFKKKKKKKNEKKRTKEWANKWNGGVDSTSGSSGHRLQLPGNSSDAYARASLA